MRLNGLEIIWLSLILQSINLTMSPTSIPGPNASSKDKNIQMANNVSAMVQEANEILENSLNVYDPGQERNTDSENSNNTTTTCSPRTPTLNPLKTFRFTQRYIHLLILM